MKPLALVVFMLIAVFSRYNPVLASECDDLVQSAIVLVNHAQEALTRQNITHARAFLASARLLMQTCLQQGGCDADADILGLFDQATRATSIRTMSARIPMINTALVTCQTPAPAPAPALPMASEQPFSGHTTFVNALAVHPSNPQIASISSDSTVRLWDSQTGMAQRQFGDPAHTGLGVALAFSPNGRYLASGGFDKIVVLWDVASGEPVYRWEQGGFVRDVAFNPRGTILAGIGADSTLYLWNTRNGQAIGAVRYGTSTLWTVAFSPNGRQILAGNDRGDIVLWDADTRERLMVVVEHNAAVIDLAFNRAGTQFVSVSSNGSMVIWDFARMTAIHRIRAHAVNASAVLWLPARDQIVTAGDDGRWVIWDAQTGEMRYEERLAGGEYITALAVLADESALVLGTNRGTVMVWELPAP